ncbi:Cytoskeleton-associated protein 5 [Phytophthora nicotianae]|uniref:Cytoskeleton-associated protein 5 n=1 Tax=Phytophthora nicotianae TaxID=4792 RepID=A0A0W8DM92_PHYNI|nr:Cytoskeleton-associated protein 5 [Phytophthora nicotianae]
MAEKCLRNASCKCSMCAGFDVASLMSISKSISSNIKYGDDEEGDAAQEVAPPPPRFGGVVNSPPAPSQKKSVVANSPPLRAVKRTPSAPAAVQNAHADTPMEDVSMAGAGAQDVVMESSPTMKDTQMESVASTLSNMEVDSPAAAGGQGEAVSIDAVLPKLTDKNWKVRKEGFEELKTLFEQPGVKTNQVRPAMELFKKMCEDANASAMEAGIAAVLAYTLNVEPFDKEIVSGVMARVTDKGFSARPGIVKLCTELTDAFIAASAAEETVTALLEGTNNRKPKVPPACATCILDALKEYGPRVVPLQAIKTALPKLMEGAVKVRPIAMSIMVEIHRWTGPALVQDIVANLRQAQQTEFEEQTKDVVPGQAAPTKFVRGAKPAKAAGGTAGKPSSGASGAAEPAAPAFDPRDFAETVDLLAKLPKTEFKAKLALPKWSEKVEALKIVLELIGPVPKLANGDYYELVSTLKALTNDSNVNIVAKSIEVFGALADGLRKNFTQYARMMFPELLRKLSDKKSVVLNATNKTLDLFLQHAMTIDMMMDDLKLACDAAKNKAPPARVQTMGYLSRAVENRYVDLNDKALIVAFGGMFMKGIDDTDPKVRDAGQKCFIVLLQATDQTAGWLQNMMDEISRKNPRAFKTIQKGLGGGGGAASTPSSRPGSAQSSRPGSAPSRPGSAPPSRPGSAGSAASRSSFGGSRTSEPDGDVEMDSTPTPAGPRRPSLKKRGPPSRLGMKPGAAGTSKAAPSRKPPAAGSSTGPSTGGGGSTDFTPIAISVTAEEAEDIIAELQLDNWSSIQEGFASSKWMERKGAIEGLEEYARANSSMMNVRVIEAFTMYLSKQVKDFKDSNINVLKSAFQAVGTFAETAASKFPRGVVCLVTPRACDKIGDRKANEAVRAMIMQFCEATSPAYTTGCMIEYMPKVRLPLAHIEALVVLSECVKDFGISICNPRALIDFAKGPQGLEGSNPKVRSAATSLLSTMYSQLGPALLPILNLESWKPALAKTVEDEFKKVGFDPAKAQATVKRQVKDQDAAPAAADPGALFGRVDVSSQITKELLEDMKNEKDKVAWKKRAEAMDSVQAICEGAGCAIEFTRPVQEVLRSLKARLNDSNANLKVKAANVIGVVATSVGPDIAKMSKILGASLIAGVADNKKTMQAAAIQALHKWVNHNNETSSACMESLLSPLSEGLLNTVGRAELLGWAAEHLQKCEKLDLSSLVAPTVQCMMDKSSEAQTSAKAGPLLKMTTNKPARISKGQYNKWIFETTSTSEMNARKGELEAEWKPYLSPEFHAKLFAPSLEKGMLAAMDELTLCIIHQADEVISSLDLVLKWCTLRIVDNNVQALAKLLEVLVKLFEMLKDTGYQLEDVEAAILLPYLLQESGQSKPRFRVRFRDVMKLVVDVYNPEKYVMYLMECFNGSKNMKSRCECIDLVEYIVGMHGYHVVGRKCIKDVGKYVVAHEKELRESAINTLVAVYMRTEGGNPDKFFRYAGITTQQGTDLLNARLKHLPASSFQSEAPAPPQQEAPERETAQLQRPQRTGFGFGFARAAAAATTAPTNNFASRPEEVQPVVEPVAIQQFNSESYDEDVDMGAPENEATEEESQSAVIEELLLRPIEMLINSSKEIVPAGTPAYKEGGNALKGLYAIINRPSDPAEVEFLHSYVNEIVLALCDCIHGAFYAGNAEKRPEMYILAISITTLTVVFNSDAVTSMQRYTVERVLLELCSKIMDPRMEKFAEKANLPASEIALLPPEEKRYLMVFKALYKAMRKLTERAKPGDVYPSVINLLQRLMHNDVGDYNKNDTLKHLLKEDSLDQLVGRILLKLSNVQANSLTPFEEIDIFGVLMQMHMFFSTLPGAEVMMVDIANDNMRSALKIMAESLMKTRSSAFEASMKDVPHTSPVRQALEEMGIGQQQKDAIESTTLRYGENGTTSNGTNTSLASAAPPRITSHFGANSAANGVAAAPEESLTRRLFPPRDSGIATRTTRTTSAAPSLAETMLSAESRGRSFTSFHAFSANRGAATNTSRPSTTSAQLESLRERLQMSRHYN